MTKYWNGKEIDEVEEAAIREMGWGDVVEISCEAKSLGPYFIFDKNGRVYDVIVRHADDPLRSA